MAVKKNPKGVVPFDAGARQMARVQAFKRLANKRVNAALKKLELIGNLSNKSSYAYTLEEVDKIADVLTKAVIGACGRFRLAPTSTDQFSI